MRRAILLIMLVTVFGCAQQHIVQKEFDPNRIRPLNELNTLNDISDLNNWVGYLDKGDSVPLKLSLESEWLGIRQDHVDLVAKRRIYFRITVPEDIPVERLEKILDLDVDTLSAMSNDERAQLFKDVMLYLSRDAVRWAPLNDRGALKEVFEIKGGTLSAGMGINDVEGAWIALSVKALSRN